MSDDSPDSAQPSLLASVVAPVKTLLEEIGVLGDLAFRAVMWTVRPPYRFQLVIAQMEFVGVKWLSLDPGIFFDRIKTMLAEADLRQGLLKSVVFGFAVTLIACRHGFFASGGAVGVGQATTRAVVWSVVGVFVLDYIITSMLTQV